MVLLWCVVYGCSNTHQKISRRTEHSCIDFTGDYPQSFFLRGIVNMEHETSRFFDG